MNRVQIDTSFSGHHRCFICRRQKVSLKEISKKSIALALINHNILIPQGTRSCYRHVKQGQITDTEYEKIPTHLEYIERKHLNFMISSSKTLLECYETQSIVEKNKPPLPPLEKFRSLSTITDEFCKEFIGLTKEKFISLSSHLNKNIRNTKNRSKTMLIALYLYWLKSGMTQKSLAYLKANSNQQKISSELRQIRIYMDRDFTPDFIGFKNVTRDFLQNQITDTVRELYNLKIGQLVFILDGGYQRCEKSFNNEFQGGTFSGQKKQNLLKPFIVATSTGYIIECYVDMDATWSDDRILRKILSTDRHFRNILRPNDLFFLDR